MMNWDEFRENVDHQHRLNRLRIAAHKNRQDLEDHAVVLDAFSYVFEEALR